MVNSCREKVTRVLLTRLLNSSACSGIVALDVIKVLDSRTIFNLAKSNTVPCMFTAVLSLG